MGPEKRALGRQGRAGTLGHAWGGRGRGQERGLPTLNLVPLMPLVAHAACDTCPSCARCAVREIRAGGYLSDDR